MTTTKRTDELRPGDRVQTPYGTRTVREVLETDVVSEFGTHCVAWEKEWYPAPRAEWAPAEQPWQVGEPSKLDLAVQRAQELVDQYDTQDEVPIAVRAKDLHDLLALFRAAR